MLFVRFSSHSYLCIFEWQTGKEAAEMKFPADERATLTVNHIPLWGGDKRR